MSDGMPRPCHGPGCSVNHNERSPFCSAECELRWLQIENARLSGRVTELEEELTNSRMAQLSVQNGSERLIARVGELEARLAQAEGLLRVITTIRILPPITDYERELYEALYQDLLSMVLHNRDLEDNGVPFRQRLETFIADLWKPSVTAFLHPEQAEKEENT